jgi:hypothetical protein
MAWTAVLPPAKNSTLTQLSSAAREKALGLRALQDKIQDILDVGDRNGLCRPGNLSEEVGSFAHHPFQ